MGMKIAVFPRNTDIKVQYLHGKKMIKTSVTSRCCIKNTIRMFEKVI